MVGCSTTLTSDAAGELDVLWHDGHSLGVDGTEIAVLEDRHKVGLGRLLECKNRLPLKAPAKREY